METRPDQRRPPTGSPAGAATDLDAPHGMLAQAMIAHACAEACGMTGSDLIRDYTRPVLDCLLRAQLRDGDGLFGGWGACRTADRVDLLATAWGLLALTAARVADLQVDELGERLAGAVRAAQRYSPQGPLADAVVVIGEGQLACTADVWDTPDVRDAAQRVVQSLVALPDTPQDPLVTLFCTIATDYARIGDWDAALDAVVADVEPRLRRLDSLPVGDDATAGSADVHPLLSLPLGRPGMTALCRIVRMCDRRGRGYERVGGRK